MPCVGASLYSGKSGTREASHYPSRNHKYNCARAGGSLPLATYCRSGSSCLARRRMITSPSRSMTQRTARGLYHRVSGGEADERSSAENPPGYNSRPQRRERTPDTVEHTAPTAAWMEDHAPRVPGRSRIAISWAIPGPGGSRRGAGARSSPGPGPGAVPRRLAWAAMCVVGSMCAGGEATVAVRTGMGR